MSRRFTLGGRPAVLAALLAAAGVALAGEAEPGAAIAAPVRVAQAPLPSSRDALFAPSPRDAAAEQDEADGKDDATQDGRDAPGSRAALFGAEEKPANGVRFSGMLDGLAAYTTAEPRHWSRTVGRLQLTAQGALSGGMKWKLSGRVDADPVYFRSDFYPSPVRRDERIDFFHGENYLDFSAADWDFRVGAQQIVWGEVVGLFFADVVSARDTREFLLPSFDLVRIPQWALRAERFFGDSHLELVWIPVPTFDRIGKPGADFYPIALPSPLPDGVADLIRDPRRPGRNLRNANFGVRANTLVGGFDLAAFYYRSFSTQPTFYRVAGDSPLAPFVLDPRYDRIWQAGGTVSKDLGEYVVRGEMIYTHGQGLMVDDGGAGDGVSRRSTLDAIASIEFNVGDTRINAQGFQRLVMGNGPTPLIGREGGGASLLLSHKWSDKVEPSLLWIRNFADGSGLVRPRVNFTAARNVTLGIGADIFTGPVDSFFGRYNNRDRVYTEVRYDF